MKKVQLNLPSSLEQLGQLGQLGQLVQLVYWDN